jgi:hypothetical protein
MYALKSAAIVDSENSANGESLHRTRSSNAIAPRLAHVLHIMSAHLAEHSMAVGSVSVGVF